ncbi:hypothetical protein GCM10022205_45440 [Spinactinospora alkalitolerans]
MAAPTAGRNGGGPPPQGGPGWAANAVSPAAPAVGVMFGAVSKAVLNAVSIQPSLAAGRYARHRPVRGFAATSARVAAVRLRHDAGRARANYRRDDGGR